MHILKGTECPAFTYVNFPGDQRLTVGWRSTIGECWTGIILHL